VIRRFLKSGEFEELKAMVHAGIVVFACLAFFYNSAKFIETGQTWHLGLLAFYALLASFEGHLVVRHLGGR
jgi:hypothetical protein